MADMHDTTEEYLETILALEEEGVPPLRARLVERLGLSAAAVSETVNRLVGLGFAQLLDDRTIRLTEKGRSLATTVVRRHRLAEIITLAFFAVIFTQKFQLERGLYAFGE